LRQQASEWDRRGAAVAVVTFEQAWRARAYVEETGLPWPLLMDPQRSLFQAYGMERGTAGEVMGWASCKAYLGLLVRGRRLRRPTDDVYQLGGDVLIDPQGIVRLHHIGRGPADRPAVSQLLAAVDAASV
jgi:alkyl hydroperoxide reductase subunit AhpC